MNIMGKPYLIQYQYGAEQIQRLSPNGKEINKFYIIGDNPEVDIKGANVFLEHLNNQTAPHSKDIHHLHLSSHHHGLKMKKSQQPVESILVCTGVYNPQNDLLYHVRHLFDHSNTHKPAIESRQVHDSCEVEDGGEENERVMVANDERLVERPREQSEQFNEEELARALSNKNSFISYFDDKLNMPDHTFENLRHSVDYILKENGLV